MPNTDFGGSMAAQLTINDLNYCRENTPAMAGQSGQQAVDIADTLFKKMEAAANRITVISADGDLTRDAKRRNAQAIYDQAIATTQASLGELDKAVDTYQEKQVKLGEIPSLQFPTIADREAVLGNIRADLRMEWDSVDDQRLYQAMLDTVQQAADTGDMNTLYLLMGAPQFAKRYAGTREAGDLIYRQFEPLANKAILPVLDATTRNAREALQREQSSKPGSISWLAQIMTVYANGRQREMRLVAGL